MGRAVFLALAMSAGAASAEPVTVKRVKIGADFYIVGAMGFDRVNGLKAQGDNFLSVREGPGETFPERDRLTNGRFVFALEDKAGWKGIVYPADKTLDSDAAARQCGLDREAAKKLEAPRPYGGPCKWGWASARFIQRLAD
jgi:hypothetical protein